MNFNSNGTASSKLIVRRASAEDAEIFLALRRLFWDDQISKGLLDIPVMNESKLMADTIAILKRPRTSTYIAFDQDHPFGYAYGHARIVPGAQKAAVGMVEELYVDVKHGSVSTGLALVRYVIDDLRAFGAARIQAKVLANNAAGIRFHETCGFKANLIFYEYDLSS